MSDKNTGGSAFPCKRVVRREVMHGNKTLRDAVQKIEGKQNDDNV